ncbi:MAG: hypothetical protein Q8P67_14910 [archaeon]|nr:hypothetical protein [archaeon]
MLVVIGYFIAVLVVAPWGYSGTTEFYANETALFAPNSWWYESLLFSSSNHTQKAHFNVYQTDHEPPLELVDASRAFNARVLVTYVEPMYLNKGSSVDLSWTCSSRIDFLLIRGYNNFANWQKGYKYAAVAEKTDTSSATISYQSERNDIYYFIWDCADHCTSANLSATARMQLVQFDLSNLTPLNCSSVPHTPCLASLTLGDPNQFVILAIDDNLGSLSISLKIQLNGRFDFYFPIFLAGGWGCWSVLSIFMLLIYFCRRRHRPAI